MAGEIETLDLIGDLPPSWKVARFGDVLEGGTRNGIYKSKEFHGRGAKVVNMGELFANPRLRAVPMKRVELSDSEMEKSCLKQGDLLFARRSLVAEGAGKCIVVAEIKEPTTFESSIIRARPNPQVADSLFLYYLFNSPYGAYVLLTIRRQVAVSGITGTDLVELPLPLPPLAEQKAIAAVLGALDDKIELNRRMNATLEAMARALFQSWFVDFDPVRAKLDGRKPVGVDETTATLFPERLEDSPLGHIPKGWKAGTVVEGFNLTMGQSPPGDTYNEEANGLPFYQGRTDFGFRFPTRRIYCSAPTRYAKPGDTLVSVRAPVGDINMANEECCIGRGVAAVRHKSGATSFTYHSMANLYSDFARFEAEGTVFGSINKDSFEKLRFVIPPTEIVAAYERQAGPLDEQIRILENQSRTLAALRDALLPKLLSGGIRVSEAESLAEKAA
jgi:type I restriction enzyme S subunit